MSEEPQFWLNEGQGATGPVPESALVQRIRSGQLGAANICPAGGGEWVPLSSHPAFAAALAPASATDTAAPAPAHPQTPRATSTRSKLPIVLIALAALGALGLTMCGGGVLLLRSVLGGRSRVATAHRPAPPTIVSSSGTVTLAGLAHQVRLEVRTEPGANVHFGPVRPRPMLPNDNVVADADGLAVFEPTALPPWTQDRIQIAFQVRGEGTHRTSDGLIALERPPHLRCRGNSSCACRMGPSCSVTLGETEITFAAPPGTRAEVAGETLTLADGSGSVAIEPIALEGDVLRGAMGGAGGVTRSYPFTLDLPDGGRLSAELRITSAELASRVGALFSDVPSGRPTTVPNAGRGGAILHSGRRGWRAFGEVNTLSDIRYVARIESTRRNRSCGRYANQRTGETVRVSQRYTDARIQLFDVRTGRATRRTTIRAPSVACRRTTSSRSQRSSYSSSAAFAWIERQAR